jgi:CDP-diacylglycerol---serine O-phosphatidyltransferase
MNIIRYLKIADCFTLGNLFAGILAVYFAALGQLTLSAALLFLAAVFDVLDGKVAGWLNEKNQFGKEIDSLSDLVSFGVAPVLVYFVLDSPGLFRVLTGLFFVACGMLRLARYNVTENSAFEGVPISVNGVIFAVLLLVQTAVPETLQFWPYLFLLQGGLMISTFKIQRLF